MNTFFTFMRWILAGLIPLGTVVGSYLVLRKARLDLGELRTSDRPCLQCGQTRPGVQASFAYTRISRRLRQQMKDDHSTVSEAPILVEESHFICDPCSRRYVLHEALMQILLALPYPAYVMFICLMANCPGWGPNLFFESFLFILAIGGAIAAWNLLQALHAGETPLAEFRDRVLIQARKKELGKDLGYYTRSGIQNLKK